METVENKNELLEVISSASLEEQTAKLLKEKFGDFFLLAMTWKEKVNGLVVTDINEVDKMKEAREGRLILKNLRVDADKVRKELKADSMKYANAVQSVYNMIEKIISPMEEHLQAQEDFVKREEERIKTELRASRQIESEPYREFLPMGIDFGNLTAEDYQKMLLSAKISLKYKDEQRIKEEQERIAAEALLEAERAAEAEKVRLALEEQEKRAKIAENRSKEVSPYLGFINGVITDLINAPEDVYQKELVRLKEVKEQHDIKEARRVSLMPYTSFIDNIEDYLGLHEFDFTAALIYLQKRKEDFLKERETQERLLKEQTEAREKAERELREKTEADLKKLEEEEKRLEELSSAKDVDKFTSLIIDLKALQTKYTFLSKKYKKKQKDVNELISLVVEHATK